jgi:hypothetical protein
MRASRALEIRCTAMTLLQSAPVERDRFVSHLYQSSEGVPAGLRNSGKVGEANRAVRDREHGLQGRISPMAGPSADGRLIAAPHPPLATLQLRHAIDAKCAEIPSPKTSRGIWAAAHLQRWAGYITVGASTPHPFPCQRGDLWHSRSQLGSSFHRYMLFTQDPSIFVASRVSLPSQSNVYAQTNTSPMTISSKTQIFAGSSTA